MLQAAKTARQHRDAGVLNVATGGIFRPMEGVNRMIRRALLVLTLAGLYMAFKRAGQRRDLQANDRSADAQWANEGGANAPESV